jgi:phosphoadenosine phosphosulfate reductase
MNEHSQADSENPGSDSAGVGRVESVDVASATPLYQLDIQDAETVESHLSAPLPVAAHQRPPVDPLLISENSTPQDLVQWGLKKFADRKVVITSSFGMEGCALIDMCNKAVQDNGLDPITVAYIDTAFFFPETHQLRRKLTERYPALNFVAWETDVSVKQQAESYGPELWKNNPNLCCHIRKVVPMKQNVVNFDVWVTALRRSQTKSRANTQVISWDWRYQILKFCPFAAWDRKHVWQYIQENDVPFNQLHLQNYPSVSCYHCTKSVPGSSPDSDVRDGRWAGKNKDECGLHFNI